MSAIVRFGLLVSLISDNKIPVISCFNSFVTLMSESLIPLFLAVLAAIFVDSFGGLPINGFICIVVFRHDKGNSFFPEKTKNFLKKIHTLDKHYYNKLIIKALEQIKIKRNLKIKDVSPLLGMKTKQLYSLNNLGKIATEKDFLKITENFPEIKKDDLGVIEETDIEYSYKSNPYKKLSEALEENNAYLKEKVERLELENSQLKAEIYKIKNG